MIVKRKEWLSKDADEAILYIGDDQYECAAFSHQFSAEEGDIITEPLHALFVCGLFRAEKSTSLSITRQGSEFDHEIVAAIDSLEKKIVSIGSILIELEQPFPGNIVVTDLIEFTCGRIAIY